MNESAPASSADPSPQNALQNSSTEQPSLARTHGAARFGDDVYWTGHAIGFALLVVALVLILAGGGPRRRDALEDLSGGPTR